MLLEQAASHGSTASGRAAQVILAAERRRQARAGRRRLREGRATGRIRERAAAAEIDAAKLARRAGQDDRGHRASQARDRVPDRPRRPKDALLFTLGQIYEQSGAAADARADLPAPDHRLSELALPRGRPPEGPAVVALLHGAPGRAAARSAVHRRLVASSSSTPRRSGAFRAPRSGAPAARASRSWFRRATRSAASKRRCALTSPRTTPTSRSSSSTTARPTRRRRSSRRLRRGRSAGCTSCAAWSPGRAGSASRTRSTRARRGRPGELLLFADADVRYAPDRDARGRRDRSERGRLDLLALFPRLEMRGLLGERAPAVPRRCRTSSARRSRSTRTGSAASRPAAARECSSRRDGVPSRGRARGAAGVGHRRPPPRDPRAARGRPLPDGDARTTGCACACTAASARSSTDSRRTSAYVFEGWIGRLPRVLRPSSRSLAWIAARRSSCVAAALGAAGAAGRRGARGARLRLAIVAARVGMAFVLRYPLWAAVTQPLMAAVWIGDHRSRSFAWRFLRREVRWRGARRYDDLDARGF